MAISEKMISFADRSSLIRKMFEEAAKMKAHFGEENVYDFSLGNPDLKPPAEFKKALMSVAQDNSPGAHGYMPNGGYPWVKDLLAQRVSKEQDIEAYGADMLMTCGAAGAMNVALKSILNPGEEVIILAPYFVDYMFYVDNHNGIPKIVNTDKEFNLDFEALEAAITEKTKAIIINSPNNPTGQVYSKEDLYNLGHLLEEMEDKYDTTIFMISDEPYRKIVFSGYEVPSVFKAYSNSIIATSYSKDLSLPGERIGYLVVHPNIRDKTALLNAMTMANRILGFINAPALMQKAVVEVRDISVDSRIYEKRKNIFCEILDNAGYTFQQPKGAFYIFPQSPIEDDAKFCSILQENKILAVPGRGFGTPGYFRLAFCVEDRVITESAAGFKKSFEEATGK